MGAVHAGAERGQRRRGRPGLLLLDPVGAVVVAVALAEVVKAKVLNLVAALPPAGAFGGLVAFLGLLILEAEELQLRLGLGLLGLDAGGSESARNGDVSVQRPFCAFLFPVRPCFVAVHCLHYFFSCLFF